MFGIQWDLVCKFIEVNNGKDKNEIRTNRITNESKKTRLNPKWGEPCFSFISIVLNKLFLNTINNQATNNKLNSKNQTKSKQTNTYVKHYRRKKSKNISHQNKNWKNAYSKTKLQTIIHNLKSKFIKIL